MNLKQNIRRTKVLRYIDVFLAHFFNLLNDTVLKIDT